MYHSYKPAEPEWCDVVDCTTQDAVKHCRSVCSKPEWCRFADCFTTRALKKCTKSCKLQPTTTEKYTTMSMGNS